MKKLLLSLTVLALMGNAPVYAVVPAMPGVEVPQIIIDRMQAEPDVFYPEPALHHTMARYAEAKQLGLDDVDDIYAYAPVICGKYSDSGPDDWPISTMQTQLFDGPWTTGTMREYYEEISFDQFHLDGTVYGWYTSTLTQAYVVGNSQGFGPDAHLGAFFVELLDAADPESDFGQYDNDGPDGLPNSGDDDGIVDAMFFIHDGMGGETGAANIWSHSSNMIFLLGGYPYVTEDPSANGGYITVGPYIVQPSINSSSTIIEIGVFCHEYGHALGLPDLYDTDYSSQGIGVWGLMGGGSWNTPSKPAHMICWSRYKLGWITPIEVSTWLHDQPITAIETTGQAYKLWTNGVYGSQYFMVENRQRYGADVNLQGEGLLIWHVHESAQQSNENHPKVDLEEADGYDNLYHNTNSGDAGDPFPGFMDNRWFDEYSYPNSRDYYDDLTQVAVWNVSDESDTMYANLDVVYSQPNFSFVEIGFVEVIGDGDGRADPGETIDLWVVLDNQWATATNLNGTLTTDAEWIDILEPNGSFGDIVSLGSGSNQSDPFQISIDQDAPDGEWLDFLVYLLASGGYIQELTFSMQIGRAPVLLVDDDLGQDYEQFIISSIVETDMNYEVWEVSQQGSPGEEILHYGTVLWMTGDDVANTLISGDRFYLETFLDWGRTLILTGQNINEDIGSTSFFSEYLRCTPNSNSIPNAFFLDGVPDNPLSAGMNLMIIGMEGAFNQTSPSSVIPQEDAEALFTYANGEVGGISYENTSTGAHVVYLAFGLEAVSGMSSTTSRAEILDIIFDWAQVLAVEPSETPNRPIEFALNGNYPNPFNPSTVISYQLPVVSHVSLSIFDIAGRRVAELVNSQLSAGKHEVTFDASGLSSGIYIYRIQAGDFTASGKMVLMK